MARYYGLAGDEPTHDSERIVAQALRALPDPWVVLHHVTWQSVRNGRQGDGEADFIVIHPDKGVLVLEVKGGGIDVEDGRWFSTDRNNAVHSIKNPYDQATDSKHALLEWFREQGFDKHVRIGHAVVLPSEFQMPRLGPAATREITFIRPDLDEAESKLNACYKHWALKASLTASEMKQIIRALAPTVRLRKTLRGESADAEVGIMTLTADQIEALSGLKASRGGLVLGGAGTGKTVLAIARSQQLASDGFRTLLVCFNELLGSDVASRLAQEPGIAAGTFHSLCFRQAKHAALRIPPNPTKEWWEKTAPQILIEACASNGSTYDAIVVDEGQDFAPLWIDALRCLTAATIDAPLFVFADPRQDLWKRDWSVGAEYDFCYTLTRNLRNTQPIAEKVAAVIGATAHSRGIPGPSPRWRTSRDRRSQEGDAVTAVETLLDAGFDPSNLVVLCESAALANRLRERSVGAYSFGTWGSKGIPVETIARFKGLESEAVVLILDDDRSDDHLTSAYIGMSRARSVLTVVATQSQQSFLGWSSSGQKS